ncbi:hypothetical protein ACA910_010608 [Epithemia clementina (nom. ined.)]
MAPTSKRARRRKPAVLPEEPSIGHDDDSCKNNSNNNDNDDDDDKDDNESLRRLMENATTVLLSSVEEDCWTTVIHNNNTAKTNENHKDDEIPPNSSATRQLSLDAFLKLFTKELSFNEDGYNDENFNNRLDDDEDKTNKNKNQDKDKDKNAVQRRQQHHHDALVFLHQQGLSAKEGRMLFFTAIECFQRGHAVRFFTGLRLMAEHIIANQHYIPAAGRRVLYEEDEPATADPRQQQPMDQFNYQQNENEIGEEPNNDVPEETSSRALLFLRLCALCTQSYLNEHIATSQKHNKAPDAEKTTSNRAEPQLEVPEEVFDMAVTLHNILFTLSQNYDCGSHGSDTQRTILKLCETWWNANVLHREYLVSQSLPLLIQSAALADSSPKSALLRLYPMRHAVSCIDFADESSEWCRSILMRVASSPKCLKVVPEGRRFIAYLFQADVSLIPSLHQAMRAQIPDSASTVSQKRKSSVVLQAYAEIYYRAWIEAPHLEELDATNDDDQEAEDLEQKLTIRDEIELHVLSDLVYSMLHAVQLSMFEALLLVLQQFHDNKRQPEVEDLLHRLYAPILWRSLAAANAHVRVRATRVLAEVFPLDQSSHAQTAKHMEKACAALRDLLQDADAQVRVAASTSVAKVLAQYWDAIPATEIRTLLDPILTQHVSDVTSPAVRTAALNAVTYLLQSTPQAHAVLRPVLPKISRLIHDKVEKVRLSAVQMLEQVKLTVSGVKYFHVVPVPHLVGRLACEVALRPMSLSLSTLMLNSYVPQGQHIRPMDQIQRTLRFLQKEPQAAAIFYACLAKTTSVAVVAKLTAWLWKCLYKAIQNAEAEMEAEVHDTSANRKRNSKRKPSSGKRKRRPSPEPNYDSETEKKDDTMQGKNQSPNIDDEGESVVVSTEGKKKSKTPLSASNPELMARVAETICLLWQSVAASLQKSANQEWRELLQESFAVDNQILHVVQYVDRKSGESGTTQEQQLLYHRMRAAMLQLASEIFEEQQQRNDLLSYMESVFCKVHDCPKSAVYRASIPVFVSLLCRWEMELEVCTSLAATISSFLDNRESRGLFDNASPRVEKRQKRGGRRPQSSSSTSSSDAIPRLPPQLALEAVAAILEDSRPMFVQARQSILRHSEVPTILGDALVKGFWYTTHVLLDKSPAPLHELSDANVQFVLRSCELYGKLNLHLTLLEQEPLQEHRVEEGDEVDTNNRWNPVQMVLKWVSNTLVPLLSTPEPRDASFLANADVSRIFASADVSRISLPGLSPPPSDGPIRQKRVRTRASTRSESSGTTLNESMISVRDDVEGAKVMKHLAESLFLWACAFLTEWINLTGTRGNVISTQAVQWCRAVLVQKSYASNDTMIRFMLRLALALANPPRPTSNPDENDTGCSSFDLFKALLIELDGRGDDVEELFDHAVATLPSVGRRVSNFASKALAQTCCQCFMTALQEAKSLKKFNDSEDNPLELALLPSSLDEFWPRQGSITGALRVLLANDESHHLMLQFALDGIVHSSDRLGDPQQQASQLDQYQPEQGVTKELSRQEKLLRLLWILCETNPPSQETKDRIIASVMPLSTSEQLNDTDIQKLARALLVALG